MPTYPGQLAYVRKNIFSAIFFLDLSVQKDEELMMQIFELIQSAVPIRFGIVPMVNDDPNSPST